MYPERASGRAFFIAGGAQFALPGGMLESPKMCVDSAGPVFSHLAMGLDLPPPALQVPPRAPPALKKARSEAHPFFFHIKVCWGRYCLTGEMRKDWPRLVKTHFLDLALEWDLESI